MSVLKGEGVMNISIDERYKRLASKSKIYDEDIVRYVAKRVMEGAGPVKIGEELNMRETQIAGIKTRLIEYRIIGR